MDNYVSIGQVKFLFKDFVINDGPVEKASTLSARASYCAADRGNTGNTMMRYIATRGENTGWVTNESLKQFARNVKVPDLMKFSDCLES